MSSCTFGITSSAGTLEVYAPHSISYRDNRKITRFYFMSDETYAVDMAKNAESISMEGTSADISELDVSSPCLYFNPIGGDYSYISVPDSADFELGSSDYSLSIWLKTTDVAWNHGIIGRRNGSTTTVQSLYKPANGHIYYRVRTAAGVTQTVDSINSITQDIWHHIAVVKSGSSIKLYIDSVDDSASASVTGDVPEFTDVLKIAGTDTYYTNSCRGYLDDFRIYKRALSPTEVSNLFNNIDISSTNLVGWWKMDETTGVIVADSSGYNNDGTITNTTSGVPCYSWSDRIYASPLGMEIIYSALPVLQTLDSWTDSGYELTVSGFNDTLLDTVWIIENFTYTKESFYEYSWSLTLEKK